MVPLWPLYGPKGCNDYLLNPYDPLWTLMNPLGTPYGPPWAPYNTLLAPYGTPMASNWPFKSLYGHYCPPPGPYDNKMALYEPLLAPYDKDGPLGASNGPRMAIESIFENINEICKCDMST